MILSSRGDHGYEEGEANADMNFQSNYLKTIFTIMGVQDIKVISLENEEYGGELFERSQREVYNQIKKIIKDYHYIRLKRNGLQLHCDLSLHGHRE